MAHLNAESFILIVALKYHQDNCGVYAYQLEHETKIPGGTVHKYLMHLHVQKKWLTPTSEDVQPHIVKRPPRRIYTLTPEGVAAAEKILEELQQALGPLWKAKPL